MQTIIIIIVVVVIIIIILITIIIVWFGPICFFFSIHRRKGSYLAYLINWNYLSVHLEVLCSSFFGRLLLLMM